MSIEMQPIQSKKFVDIAKTYQLNKLQSVYVRHYGVEFDAIAETVTDILLVGDSLPMALWQEYFPNAIIHVAEVDGEAYVPAKTSLVVFDSTYFDGALLSDIAAHWPLIPVGAIVSFENCGLSFDDPDIADTLEGELYDRPNEKGQDGTSLVDAAIGRNISLFINDAEWIKTLFNRWHILVKNGVMGSGE